MCVTADHYDANVISGNEVMLRTKSTFRNRGTDVAGGAAFHKGDSRFERLEAGILVSEVAKRASEAVIDAQRWACHAIADWCGSEQEAGVASLFDLLAGRSYVVRPRVGGSCARR